MTGVHKRYVRKMCGFCTQSIQTLMLVLVVTGLLAPRMSAVLAKFIPGMHMMVICTGDSLITITIGPDGEPVEHDEATQHPCVMADRMAHVPGVAPQWVALTRDFAHSFAIHENTQSAVSPVNLISPTRGPPALV